ncbi:MAG: NAD-dependent epimerase/dehydratase family protein [Fimbriimonas sp.]
MKNTHFVTGGCGFVGRHLTARIVRDGDSAWIVDDLSTGQNPSKWIESVAPGFELTKQEGLLSEYRNGDQTITFVQADALPVFISETSATRPSPDLENIKLPDFHTVFHLASIVGGRAMIDGDPLKVGIDLGIDAAMFLWASRPERKDRIGRIMYASSSAAYPIHLQAETTHIPLVEDYISFDEKLGMPDMTYGWSKLTGEFLSRLAASKYGLHVGCIRPFSGYGEDQDLTYPTPSIALRIARRDNPVEVWGTGEQGRDFVHIDDCVDAMYVILDNVKDGRGINVGTGELTSFNQLITAMAKEAGYEPEIKRLLDKPVGVASRYAIVDTILAMGWKPTITLEEGARRMVRHFEGKLNRGEIS